MEFLSIFSRSPEKQIQRLRKKVKQPHGDASVRISAAEKLAQMGTPQAIRALLDRFTISVTPSSEDEREREQVFHWLVEHRDSAIEPILQFLREERLVYWPIRVLREIMPPDELAVRIRQVLEFHWENPPADTEPIAQIIRSIPDIYSEDLCRTIQLFLQGETDELRLAAILYLLERPEEEAREPILQCYVESEDRPRVRSQILEHLADKGWSVRGFRPVVEETLPEGFSLTRDGKLRRIGQFQ